MKDVALAFGSVAIVHLYARSALLAVSWIKWDFERDLYARVVPVVYVILALAASIWWLVAFAACAQTNASLGYGAFQGWGAFARFVVDGVVVAAFVVAVSAMFAGVWDGMDGARFPTVPGAVYIFYSVQVQGVAIVLVIMIETAKNGLYFSLFRAV